MVRRQYLVGAWVGGWCRYPGCWIRSTRKAPLGGRGRFKDGVSDPPLELDERPHIFLATLCGWRRTDFNNDFTVPCCRRCASYTAAACVCSHRDERFDIDAPRVRAPAGCCSFGPARVRDCSFAVLAVWHLVVVACSIFSVLVIAKKKRCERPRRFCKHVHIIREVIYFVEDWHFLLAKTPLDGWLFHAVSRCFNDRSHHS